MQRNDMVLGIDIGATETAFGFVDGHGKILTTAVMPTMADRPAEDFLPRLKIQIDALGKPLPEGFQLRGIGLGAPNAHPRRGTIENPVNLKWGAVVHLKSLLQAYYNLPIALTNDASTAAIGEKMFGSARSMKDFMVVTLGTGLGCGLVLNDRLHYGASGFAGELGHTTVDPEGRQCHCGKRGCLEAYVSASGLIRTALEMLALRNDPSRLRALKIVEITAKRIFELASKGDAIALSAFDQTARILGMKLADAVAHISPEAIFLTGGLASAGDLLIDPTARYLDEFLFSVYRGTVKIAPSGLPAGTGAVLGASALIWNELKS